MMSLQQLSISVIMSALMEQRSLEPDQLHVRLPCYVPPRFKSSIVDSFKAHTFWHPPSPIVERIHARNQTNCAFCDKSMKLGTWFLDILRSILRNGAISDLTFGDL